MAEYCNYGPSFDELLCNYNCLECGMNNDTTQDSKLIFRKAMELAQGLESTTKNATKLKLQAGSIIKKISSVTIAKNGHLKKFSGAKESQHEERNSLCAVLKRSPMRVRNIS